MTTEPVEREVVRVEQRHIDAAGLLVDDWYTHGRPTLTRDTTWIIQAFAHFEAALDTRAHGYRDGLEAALVPFALEADGWNGTAGVAYHDSLELWQTGYQTKLKVGDLRRARAALAAIRALPSGGSQ